MADTRRVYIDSCSFIDMVKTSIGKKVASDREQDVWHLKKLLEASRDKEIEIFTSALTIAECTHAGDNPISEATKDVFSSMLMSGQYVKIVQVTPFIAEAARDLRWKYGISLKGADAIHVASAIDRKCEELLTTNGRMQRVTKHQSNLDQFGLKLRSGRHTLCLPDRYRQLGLTEAVGSPATQQSSTPGMH